MQVKRGILIRLFHCCQRIKLAEIQCVCFALEYFTVPFAVVKNTAQYIFDEKPTKLSCNHLKIILIFYVWHIYKVVICTKTFERSMKFVLYT